MLFTAQAMVGRKSGEERRGEKRRGEATGHHGPIHEFDLLSSAQLLPFSELVL